MTADDDKVLPAIHLCSVPATSLPGLVTDAPVVDADRYEFGRRVVGKLIAATVSDDGATVTAKVAVRVQARAPLSWRDGDRPVRLIPFTFTVDARAHLTAHLPADVMARTPGAIDVEHG